jgi:thiol-disulfide isomerase/thioredoxin
VSTKPSLRRTLLIAILLGAPALALGIWWAGKQSTNESDRTTQPNTSTVSDADAVNTLFGLSFNDPTGVSIALSKYRGKPLVINFWATWCPPCVEEMPELSEWQKEVGDSVKIIGIGIDSPSNVQTFVAKNTFNHQLLVAGMGGSEIARLLGNPSGALPFTVVISATGQITNRTLGRFSIAALKSAVTIK